MKMSLIFLLMMASIAVAAQQISPGAYSLQQAVDTALKNRYDLQANQYNVLMAVNTIGRAKKEWIPVVTGNGTIRYNAQLQATYIPAGFGGLTEPTLLALGAKSVTILGLDLNQAIYRPAIRSNINIAKNNLEWQKERNRQAEIDIKVKVTEAYLNVLLKDLQQKIAGDNEQRYKEYAEIAEGKFRQGTLLENDHLRAALDYNNSRIQTEIARQHYRIALDQLKYEMNLPAATAVTLTDTIGTAVISNTSTTASPDNRTEVRQLLFQQYDNKLQLKKAKESVLPTVSLIANYSQQFLYEKFEYGRSRWWSPFSYVGVTFSLPITDHIKNAHQIREYQQRIRQTELNLLQRQTDIAYEIQQSEATLRNAERNLQIMKSNYALSGTIYENQRRQYSLGSFEYNDLLDTERSLNTAEQNYVKVVYDLLVAKVAYEKALDNF
ncbi:MAG TPA: TolC family protein [Chitinophaga sp.]|uniref:TolC family protein n=1 Tax=Chitinophaga sp. TaxID=1869181 RepID=UPI002C8601F1|nr:TolC family protein [Chitinophaga sp.]HVI45852.1 TolC family protein [Chitinophaga sp.]